MKKEESLTEQSAEQLNKNLKEFNNNYLKLKIDLKMAKLKDYSQLKKMRIKIARIKTVLREKELKKISE